MSMFIEDPSRFVSEPGDEPLGYVVGFVTVFTPVRFAAGDL